MVWLGEGRGGGYGGAESGGGGLSIVLMFFYVNNLNSDFFPHYMYFKAAK